MSQLLTYTLAILISLGFVFSNNKLFSREKSAGKGLTEDDKSQKANIMAGKKLVSTQIEKIINSYKNARLIPDNLMKKKPLQISNYPVTLKLSSYYPRQGESLTVNVKSDKKIEKVFGYVGERELSFLPLTQDHSHEAHVGFDIQEGVGTKKVLVGVLFKDYSVKYLHQNIVIKHNVVTPYVPYYVYQNRWFKRKYWHKGRLKTRWVKLKVRVLKYMRPPTLARRYPLKTFEQLKRELKNIMLATYQKNIGGGDEEVNTVNEKKAEKENKLNELELFISTFQQTSPQKFWKGSFLQPTYLTRYDRISQFGSYRVFPYKGHIRRGYHRGLDISKAPGTRLQAPNYGKVVIAGSFKYRGNAVVIDHGGGVYSVHYHLLKIHVEKGMFVRKGQLIGEVGSTGISTGPHLHWEIRVRGTSVNPMQWKNP